jgi:molybdopterin-binding protein
MKLFITGEILLSVVSPPVFLLQEYSNRGMVYYPVVKTMKISARNQIPGTVKMIKKGPVSTEVVISIAGGNEIVSSITTHSAESLKLHEGSKVFAIVKASEVMVGID